MNVQQKPDVKHIADIVGEWGKWQFHLIAHCFILWGVVAINNMGYSFHAYDNNFWCNDVPTDYVNKTTDMKCFKYMYPNESCTDWQYDRTEFGNSIITEFDLVCQRANYASMSQTAYMLGYLVSGLVFAHYSDKYGRRPIIWVGYMIELSGILFCILSPNIFLYSFSRFLVGMGSSGRAMATYILLLECCGPKYRADITILGGIGWVFGYALIPGLAYWVQDYRYMQLTALITLFVMLVWFYFFFESPRWQITNGQLDRAEHTLRKALQMNGKSDQNLKQQLNILFDYLQQTELESKKQHNYTLLDLVKTPVLRKTSLIMWYSWAVNALLYYGLSFNMSDFGGNFYVTFLLSGLVELPSQVLSVVLLRYIGRSKLFALFMFMTGASCLAVIPSKQDWLRVMFALIGKFCVNSSWNVISIQGPELYPTVLRQRGLGMSSVIGRIGSIIAPYMKNLAATSGLALVMTIYGCLTLVGAVLALFLPETKGREMPDTIEEAERNLNSIKMFDFSSKPKKNNNENVS